jgi:hypothetical protein
VRKRYVVREEIIEREGAEAAAAGEDGTVRVGYGLFLVREGAVEGEEFEEGKKT